MNEQKKNTHTIWCSFILMIIGAIHFLNRRFTAEKQKQNKNYIYYIRTAWGYDENICAYRMIFVMS